MKRLNIRWKLTLWYGGVLAVILVGFSASVYWSIRQQALGKLDQGLDEELTDVLFEVNRAKDSRGLLDWLEIRFARHEGFDFQVTRSDGRRFFANPRLEKRTLPIPPTSLDSPRYETVQVEQDGFRLVSVQAHGPDGPLTVQVARSLSAFNKEMASLFTTFAVAVPLAWMLTLGGGYLLARRALAPVQAMTNTANEITADRLNQRLAVDNADDELGALAQTLNHMIERLERSFAEMQRFTTDAAHELRTPLAVLRTEAEVALRSPRSGEDYRGVIENLLEEINRLTQLADQLLFLSRSDAGLQPQTVETLAVHELLHDVTANMQIVAQEKGIVLTLENGSACHLRGDGRQLRRVFYNLLDNAIKYTPAPGKVSVTAKTHGQALTVSVEDTGVGIPPDHLPHIFERFYRVDPARSGDSGAGLGLAICYSIVRAMDGEIRVHSQVGRGTTFQVILPERVIKNEQAERTRGFQSV